MKDKQKQLFSTKEKNIAISILNGASISECSRLYSVSKVKCQAILNTFCSKSNRSLFCSLRHSEFDFNVPLTKLRMHADIFIEGAKELENITIHSTIWALPNVPYRTLNALDKMGVDTIEKILESDLRSLARIKNVGKKGLEKLQESLKHYGFSIRSCWSVK